MRWKDIFLKIAVAYEHIEWLKLNGLMPSGMDDIDMLNLMLKEEVFE